MDPFLLARWVHILSSTVLFGTGIGTAFQMVMAMRSQNPQVIQKVAENVVLADWIFTTPAGLVQPLSGLWLIYLAGYDPFEPWLLLVYALYALAFLCWAPVVHLQIRIRDLAASACQAGTDLPKKTHRLYRLWFALGWPAFGALTALFWLMIARPDLT